LFSNREGHFDSDASLFLFNKMEREKFDAVKKANRYVNVVELQYLNELWNLFLSLDDMPNILDKKGIVDDLLLIINREEIRLNLDFGDDEF
jgi:hypothetical protein